MVINIFVIYQLGLGFKLKNSLWRELCGYLLIKKPFVNNYELLKLKIWIGYLAGPSQMEKFILIHISNLLLGFNIHCNIKW